MDELPKGSSLSKTALSSSNYKHYTAQPPIEHLFRAPEKRPNSLISMLFLGAICVLFAAFNLILFNHFNTKLFGGLMSLVFFGLLAGVVALIWNFYFWMTLFQTVTFIFPVVITLLFVGNLELSACRETRYLVSTGAAKKEN